MKWEKMEKWKKTVHKMIAVTGMWIAICSIAVPFPVYASQTESQAQTESAMQAETQIVTPDMTLMEAREECTVFASPDQTSDILGKLAAGDKIMSQKMTDNGWCVVTYQGGKGYIDANMLKQYGSTDETLESALSQDVAKSEENQKAYLAQQKQLEEEQARESSLAAASQQAEADKAQQPGNKAIMPIIIIAIVLIIVSSGYQIWREGKKQKKRKSRQGRNSGHNSINRQSRSARQGRSESQGRKERIGGNAGQDEIELEDISDDFAENEEDADPK